MRLLNRHVVTGGILIVAVAALVGTSASATSTVKITNCTSASSRPKTVTLTCGDGNTVLTGLRWSSFGGASALATGTLQTNTCTPNCAAGRVVRYSVVVRANSPRTCKAGLRVYGKVTLRFAGRAPSSAGSLKHWTLGCPY
jgi:hypothetical protein